MGIDLEKRRADRLFHLTQRAVLVTGAGRGIGEEIAWTFAAQGALVIVSDVDSQRADLVTTKITRAGGRAICRQCDVTSAADVERMFNGLAQHGLLPDILINNAGNGGTAKDLGDTPSFWETEPVDWEPWLAVNLTGVMNVVRYGMAGMMERGWGRLITVSSDAGRVGEARMIPYSAAKAGAAGFMRAVAKAVGRNNITANTIALGAIETPSALSVIKDGDIRARVLRHYIVRRLGRPADAAAMALYLASDVAEWVTGQTFPVNGGHSLAL